MIGELAGGYLAIQSFPPSLLWGDGMSLPWLLRLLSVVADMAIVLLVHISWIGHENGPTGQ